MPEQDADVLEILIGQMAEIREINAVLGEAFGIPPQPEFLQPFCDRLHCGPRSPVPHFHFGAGKEAQSYHFWRRAGRAKLHRTRRRSRRRPGAEVFVTAPISMTAARLSVLVLPYFYVNDTIDGSRRRGRAHLCR